MSRKLSHSSRFPFDSKLIYEIATEKEFWEMAFEEINKVAPEVKGEILKLETTESGTEIVTKQILPHEWLPPIAQAVMKFDLIITRQDNFEPLVDDKCNGTFTASIPAGPGWLKGVSEIFPTDSGCTIRRTSEVKVYIPFVGGKLEQLILVNLIELAKAEAEFMTFIAYKRLGLNPADYPESFTEHSQYWQLDLSKLA